MDMIVDRLSAIEQAAARILDSAALEKKELESESMERIQAYDARIDQEMAAQLKALQESLDTQVEQELSQLRQDTQKTISMIEMDYETNHEKLADEILQKIIAR